MIFSECTGCIEKSARSRESVIVSACEEKKSAFNYATFMDVRTRCTATHSKTPNGFSLKLRSLRSSRVFLAFQPKNQTRIYSRFSFSSFSAFVCLFYFALCCSQSPFHSPYVYQCVHVFAKLAEHYCVRVKKRKMRFFISRNNIHILQWIWVYVCVCKQVFKQLANNI